MFSLYLITPAAPPADILRALDSALIAEARGQVCVQLRAKHCHARDQYELALSARALCHARGARLVVNDRVDIALSVGADGVHLPEQGMPLTAARRLLGDAALIGASCHDPEGLARAADAGASFVTLSPVFATADKGPPLDVATFAEWTAAARVPVYALGGIRPEHSSQLCAAGAAGLAVISAVFAATAPGAAVYDLMSAWSRARVQ